MEEITNHFSCLAFLLSFSFFAQSEYKHQHVIENCFCTLYISSLSKHLPTAVLFWSWHGGCTYYALPDWRKDEIFEFSTRCSPVTWFLLLLLLSKLGDIKAFWDFCQRHSVSCTNRFSKQAKRIIFFFYYICSVSKMCFIFILQFINL